MNGYQNDYQKTIRTNCDCPYLKIHDAVAKDNDCLLALLRRCETEMRYAGWGKLEQDNYGRNDVYEEIVRTLK